MLCRVAAPSETFLGAGGHPWTVQKQLGQAHGRARDVLVQSRAKTKQDGVTSGHGAGLLRSLGRVGWGFFLFFSPFSISAIRKHRAELTPAPLCRRDQHCEQLGQGPEVSTRAERRSSVGCFWLFIAVCLLGWGQLLPVPVLGSQTGATLPALTPAVVSYLIWLLCLNLQLLESGE